MKNYESSSTVDNELLKEIFLIPSQKEISNRFAEVSAESAAPCTGSCRSGSCMARGITE